MPGGSGTLGQGGRWGSKERSLPAPERQDAPQAQTPLGPQRGMQMLRGGKGL